MYGDGTVYLVDTDGKVAHTWQLPYRPGLYGHLLPSGHLFYGGKVMEDLERFARTSRAPSGSPTATRSSARAATDASSR
jgi:hypothetical protein